MQSKVHHFQDKACEVAEYIIRKQVTNNMKGLITGMGQTLSNHILSSNQPDHAYNQIMSDLAVQVIEA